MVDVDVPRYSAEDIVRIQTACIVLDNELQRQQLLWRAAQEVRSDVLPAVKQMLQILLPQTQIGTALAQEIVDLQAAVVVARTAHDAAIAGYALTEKEAMVAHKRAIEELRSAEAGLRGEVTAETQHTAEVVREAEEARVALQGVHNAELLAAQAEQALALAGLADERGQMQKQITELQATRERLAGMLRNQLTTLAVAGEGSKSL